MSTMNRLLAKTIIAAAEVRARRIVKLNASRQVLPSAADTDNHVGVSDTVGPVPIGERCDVIVTGIAEVEAGAAIAPGEAITADAQGRATPAAAGDTAVGYAFTDAEQTGDFVDVVLGRHVL